MQNTLTKALVGQKEGDSFAAINMMNKKFKGLNMAAKVVEQALIKKVSVEKDQISLEYEHLENIKQSFGYDLKKDQFIMNYPIDF